MVSSSTSSKSGIVLFNPEQTPAVYSEDGRTVGGAERVTVDKLDPVGQRAVDTGLLVREEPQKPEGSKGELETASKDAPPLPEEEKSGDGGGSGASSRARRA